MTTKQLEALNHKTRIQERILAGEIYKEIAFQEGVTRNYVSKVALGMGIRKLLPRKVA